MRLYDVTTIEKPEFLMRAPLQTIEAVFHLRKEAIQRIEREAVDSGGVCLLYFNNKPWNGVKAIAVMLAKAPCQPTL